MNIVFTQFDFSPLCVFECPLVRFHWKSCLPNLTFLYCCVFLIVHSLIPNGQAGHRVYPMPWESGPNIQFCRIWSEILGQIVFQVADSTKAGPLAVSDRHLWPSLPHLFNALQCVWSVCSVQLLAECSSVALVAFLRGGGSHNRSQISVKHPPAVPCIHPPARRFARFSQN